MPDFNSKEEYEKWKAERANEIKENPNRKTMASAAKSHSETKSVAITAIKKAVALIRTLLHNWAEASKRKKAIKKIRQQEQLQEKLQTYKNNKRKMHCPSCRTSISVNAVSCPKCGQPMTDSIWQKEILRKQTNSNVMAAIVLIPLALLACVILIAVIFHENIVKYNAEVEAKRNAEIAQGNAEIVAEVHKLPPDVQKKFIDNTKSVLNVLEHYGDEVPYFELTGSTKLDSFLSPINQEIKNTNVELKKSKEQTARQIEPFEREAKRLVLGGTKNVDKLADIGRTIDELSANSLKPIDNLRDKYEDKLSKVLHEISPETSTTTTKSENINPETKSGNEISDINKANKEVQKSIINESTEFLLETKDRKILRWSNYTEENNNYCTYESSGKFCVPKSEVVSIRGKTIRKTE